MMLGRDRLIRVISAVEELRVKYPELGHGLTWRAIEPILQRERIRIARHEIVGHGYVVAMPPAFTIVLNRADSAGKQLGVTAHELGHIVMHVDRERVKQLSPCLPDDPRELEAKLFARMLLIGGNGTPNHPKVAPLVARLVAGEYRQRMPEQLPLELPQAIPQFRILTGRDAEEEFAREDAERAAARQRRRAFRRAGELADSMRLELFPPGQYDYDARFDDREGRRWFTVDGYVMRDGPARTLARSLDGAPITHRLFADTLFRQRVYTFVKRELREHTTARLDRQLAESRGPRARVILRSDHVQPATHP